MTAIALTIAGSDPSGGAGLQADLKTFHQHGVYGAAVVSLLTVQSTRGVARVDVVDADLVGAQLDHLLADVAPRAAKTGALGSRAVVEAVAARAARFAFPLVVDPVMISKHGHRLISEEAQGALISQLLPHTFLLTPNAPEAAALLGRPVETLAQAREAARALGALGPAAVLVKGGHLEGDAVDVLWHRGALLELPQARLDTPHTHGTGCTYAAAITARLALGEALEAAVRGAKAWLTEALRRPPRVGHGVGPVNHFAPVVDLPSSERGALQAVVDLVEDLAAADEPGARVDGARRAQRLAEHFPALAERVPAPLWRWLADGAGALSPEAQRALDALREALPPR